MGTGWEQSSIMNLHSNGTEKSKFIAFSWDIHFRIMRVIILPWREFLNTSLCWQIDDMGKAAKGYQWHYSRTLESTLTGSNRPPNRMHYLYEVCISRQIPLSSFDCWRHCQTWSNQSTWKEVSQQWSNHKTNQSYQVKDPYSAYELEEGLC